MKPTTIVAALASIALLAACDTQTDPAQPPTSEPALTTATAAAPPPQDDTQTTTEAAPTTEPPTEEADGPPEMPDEATEQTEAGAEAFVGHYLDTYNYAFASADASGLGDLATENCASCANLVEGIPTVADPDLEYLTYGDAQSLLTDNTAQVTLPVTQSEYEGVPETRGVAIFRLSFDGQWAVDGIQMQQR